MIIDLFVTTKWSKRNKKYYESLGYYFTKHDDEFVVFVGDLIKRSSAKINAICDSCFNIRTLNYSYYKPKCKYCTRVVITQKEKFREMSKARRGPLCYNYRRDKRNECRNTQESLDWAIAIKRRDNRTCQVCGVRGGGLDAHHLMAWASYPELRLELSNGITLCRCCHKTFHKIYGRGSNTKEQFEEFKQNNRLQNSHKP